MRHLGGLRRSFEQLTPPAGFAGGRLQLLLDGRVSETCFATIIQGVTICQRRLVVSGSAADVLVAPLSADDIFPRGQAQCLYLKGIALVSPAPSVTPSTEFPEGRS